MSRNVKVLAAAGLVDMEAADDLRQKRITLSKKGRRKLTDSTISWRIAQDQVLSSAKAIFAGEDNDPLIGTLEKLQALAAAADTADLSELTLTG